jgi:hypothetical protein
MKIIFLIRVFRWCKSAMCSRRSLSCPNSNHHLFPASIFEFKYLINQVSRPSVNSKEHPSSKKISPTFVPLRSSPSLSIVIRRQESSATPAFLTPISACHPIGNGRKDFSFRPFCYLVSTLKSKHPLSLKTQISFWILIESFALCCFPMAIAIARLSAKDTQIFVGNLRKMSPCLVFKVSGVFISDLGQKIKIVSFSLIYSSQNFSSIHQFR